MVIKLGSWLTSKSRWKRDAFMRNALRPSPIQLEAATALLEEGLELKANAGGAIKVKIRKAIALLALPQTKLP